MVYGVILRGPEDLLIAPDRTRFHGRACDAVEEFASIHQQVRDNLEAATSKYKAAVDVHRREVQFKVGDLVWVVLTKERFPTSTYNKLKPRKVGPLEVLEKINNNAYRLKLPPHMHTADVFNVKHLVPFEAEDTGFSNIEATYAVTNSGSNFFLPRGT